MMGLRLDHAGFLATLVAALLAFLVLPAGAEDRYLDIRPGGQFKPVTIAVSKFAGADADGAKLTSIITNNFKRSVFLSPTESSAFPESDPKPRLTPARRLEADGRAVRGHRSHAAGRRPHPHRVPAVGSFDGRAGGRAAICDRRRQLAARRAHHLGRHLHAHHGREGLLRQPRGVRRRVRPGRKTPQAPCHHGSGWGQREISHPWRGPRGHAALLADRSGSHLHGLRPGRAARSIFSTSRPASGRSSAISRA